MSDVWGSDAGQVWLVGAGGALHKREPAGWVSQRSPGHELGADLKFIQGADAKNVFAAGTNQDPVFPQATLLQWDGKTWTDLPTPIGTASSFWVGGAASVWVGGTTRPSYLGSLKMWDGMSWAVGRDLSSELPRAIGGSGPSDVLFATSGTLYHWDGATFSDSPGVPEAEAIWTYDANNIWWVGGAVGTFRGNKPLALDLNVIKPVHAIWGTSPDNVWVVGEAGTIAQCARSKPCTPQPSGTTRNLKGVWAASPSAAWAVGDAGTLVEWDGRSWTPRSIGVSVDLYAVWGASSTDVWIAGEHGTILRKRR